MSTAYHIALTAEQLALLRSYALTTVAMFRMSDNKEKLERAWKRKAEIDRWRPGEVHALEFDEAEVVG